MGSKLGFNQVLKIRISFYKILSVLDPGLRKHKPRLTIIEHQLLKTQFDIENLP